MKKILLSFICSLLVSHSVYAIVPGHLMDAVYDWPQQLWESDMNISILNDPGSSSAYYWSHFFVFSNSSGFSRVGYIGLQTNGKKAIFSIWNALDAQGPNCRRFGGEGVGYQCLINYNFQQGHTYRVRVWRLSNDNTGDWWGGWISDIQTRVENTIGFIKSPPNSGLIKKSYLFDEYFLDVSACSMMSYAKVDLSRLTGNLDAITPSFSYWVPEGPCKSYIFTQFNGNNFTAASPRP
jgi:hypothetical protein